MNDTPNGGPAFPCVLSRVVRSATKSATVQDEHPGLSARDWFAGQALAGILTTASEMTAAARNDVRRIAQDCYTMADAMLAARDAAKETR